MNPEEGSAPPPLNLDGSPDGWLARTAGPAVIFHPTALHPAVSVVRSKQTADGEGG